MTLPKTTIPMGAIAHGAVPRALTGSGSASGGAESGGGSGSSLPNAVFAVDATQSGSYGGSGQTLANIIASPADGSSQTAYDFYLGENASATTSDPTFTGTAGNSAAYFAHDGADWFNLQAANSAFINSLHKGTQNYWAAVALQTLATDENFALLGTGLDSNEYGMRLIHSSANGITLQARHGAAGLAFNDNAGSSSKFPTSSDVLMVVSVDLGTAITVWVNGSKFTMSATNYSATTTADANDKFAMAGLGNSAQQLFFASGMRFYAAAMGNSALSDAQAADIRTYFANAHGRTY